MAFGQGPHGQKPEEIIAKLRHVKMMAGQWRMRSAGRTAMQLEMDPNASTPQALGAHKIARPTTQVQLGLAKRQQCHLRVGP